MNVEEAQIEVASWQDVGVHRDRTERWDADFQRNGTARRDAGVQIYYLRDVMRAQNVTSPRVMSPAFTETALGSWLERSMRCSRLSRWMRRCAARSGGLGIPVRDDCGIVRCNEANGGTQDDGAGERDDGIGARCNDGIPDGAGVPREAVLHDGYGARLDAGPFIAGVPDGGGAGLSSTGGEKATRSEGRDTQRDARRDTYRRDVFVPYGISASCGARRDAACSARNNGDGCQDADISEGSGESRDAADGGVFYGDEAPRDLGVEKVGVAQRGGGARYPDAGARYPEVDEVAVVRSNAGVTATTRRASYACTKSMARDAIRFSVMRVCLTEVACVLMPPEVERPPKVGSEEPCETLEAMGTGSMRAYRTAVAQVVMHLAMVCKKT